jgi:hypothetical protein
LLGQLSFQSITKLRRHFQTCFNTEDWSNIEMTSLLTKLRSTPSVGCYSQRATADMRRHSYIAIVNGPPTFRAMQKTLDAVTKLTVTFPSPSDSSSEVYFSLRATPFADRSLRSGLAVYLQPDILVTSFHLLESPHAGDLPPQIECSDGRRCTLLTGPDYLKGLHWDHVGVFRLENNTENRQNPFASVSICGPDPSYVFTP